MKICFYVLKSWLEESSCFKENHNLQLVKRFFVLFFFVHLFLKSCNINK